MKKITINVTQEDINKGRKKDCKYCPIALAVSRLVKPEIWFKLGGTCLILGSPTTNIISLPLVAQEFISEFDNGRPVSPFSFEIEIKEIVFNKYFLCQQ